MESRVLAGFAPVDAVSRSLLPAPTSSARIDPSSLPMAASGSVPSAPVFFVMSGQDAHMRNVFFDAQSNQL